MNADSDSADRWAQRWEQMLTWVTWFMFWEKRAFLYLMTHAIQEVIYLHGLEAGSSAYKGGESVA